MKNILTLLACSLVISITAQIPVNQIDDLINSKFTEKGPGVMVGIVKDGQIVYEKYRGLANIEHQVKMNEKTRSNIASTAKQFTALMILQLEMEGKLTIEEDIRKYLPKLYKDVENEIKIRHVINHTSGIRDYVELYGLEGDVWWKRVGLDNGDVMELLEKQEDLGFKPGSRFSYSNSGYIILAEIIEKVSGQKFTDYSDAFFQSLGMNETSFIKRYMGVIPNKAAPYSDWGYGELFHSISVTKTAGEGFLYTTLKDQLRFELALQNANTTNNTLLMKSQLPIPNSEIKTYGFGLKFDSRLGRKTVYHDGVTDAYNAIALRFPEDNLSIFILGNNGNVRSDLLADDIARLILPEQESEITYDSKFFETNQVTENIEILGQYYTASGFLTRIVEEDQKIFFRQGKYRKLELVKDKNNTYYFAADSKEKLRFYKDKMIIFYASGEAYTYNKINIPPASFTDLEAFIGSYTNTELNISFELKLNDNDKLELLFSNDSNKKEVLIFNREDLLAGNSYYLKVYRDNFDRVIEMKLSYDRAKNISFKKTSKLKFQPKIDTEEGTIQVTTIGSRSGDTSDILLTKNYPNGNEIWSKRFGGSSYDKASSILATEDGYLIIGSTSSYGEGNYDIFVIKTDKQGNKLWQNTYGKFYNEYGYSAEKSNTGYLIKGTIQNCTSNSDVFDRTCTTNVWFVGIDKLGKEISNEILEEVN